MEHFLGAMCQPGVILTIVAKVAALSSKSLIEKNVKSLKLGEPNEEAPGNHSCWRVKKESPVRGKSGETQFLH